MTPKKAVKVSKAKKRDPGVSTQTRHERFVEAFLRDPNGARAARDAGYSERSAKTIARDLLKRPDIRAAIDEGRARYKETLGLDAHYVMATLKRTADNGDSSSAVRAAELIGKHLGMFVERTETTVDVRLSHEEALAQLPEA
jgi:hypothetical protein